MASYNQKFNSDDSVIRHVIIGLLAELNNRVYFHRQLDKDTRTIIDIPFYYSITGDDQFLRDNFLFSTASGPDCFPDKSFADGNYDAVPRGVANLTSILIDSSSLVNPRNPGRYTKLNNQGALEGYTAEFEHIPVTIGIDVEILVSSMLDSLKIAEMMIKQLYKSNYYNVEVGHLDEGTYKIACSFVMPDDYDTQRPLDFTFDDKENYKITIPIEIQAKIPAFEWETERHIGNRMFQITNNIIPSIDENSGETIDTNIVSQNNINEEALQQISASPNTNILEIIGTSKVYQFVDGTLVSNLLITSNSTSVEVSLVAINSAVTIDTSNFPGVSAITINENGTLTIKRNETNWYIISAINSDVTY